MPFVCTTSYFCCCRRWYTPPLFYSILNVAAQHFPSKFSFFCIKYNFTIFNIIFGNADDLKNSIWKKKQSRRHGAHKFNCVLNAEKTALVPNCIVHFVFIFIFFAFSMHIDLMKKVFQVCSVQKFTSSKFNSFMNQNYADGLNGFRARNNWNFHSMEKEKEEEDEEKPLFCAVRYIENCFSPFSSVLFCIRKYYAEIFGFMLKVLRNAQFLECFLWNS